MNGFLSGDEYGAAPRIIPWEHGGSCAVSDAESRELSRRYGAFRVVYTDKASGTRAEVGDGLWCESAATFYAGLLETEYTAEAADVVIEHQDPDTGAWRKW